MDPQVTGGTRMTDETRNAIKGIAYLVLTVALFITAAFVEGW